MIKKSLFLAAAVVLGLALPGIAQDGPSRTALSAAERYVAEFEIQVERAKGAPFTPGHDAREAMKRVSALAKEHGDDPKVAALFARVRAAILASRGEVFQIAPAMLAYRDAQMEIVRQVGARGDAAWATLTAADDRTKRLQIALPAPDVRAVPAEDIIGQHVLLDGNFAYPAAQFVNAGRDYVAVGGGQDGYYFVDISGAAWKTAYGALREYQSLVSADTPGPWSVWGRITALDIMVPDASAESSVSPSFGWVVEPLAIHLPGKVTALAAGDGPGGFEGAADLEALKAGFYTITSVADDADPLKVMAAYIAAMKERNWTFYETLVHENWQQTDRARERVRYYWDITQRRFRDLYVHVEPVEVVETITIQGEAIDDLESLFLTEDDVADLTARSEPLIEQAVVRIVRYDARGVQVEPDNRITLRRTDGGPWRIYGPWPL